MLVLPTAKANDNPNSFTQLPSHFGPALPPFTAVFIKQGHPNFGSTQAGFQKPPSANLPRLKIIFCKIKYEKNEKMKEKTTISPIARVHRGMRSR